MVASMISNTRSGRLLIVVVSVASVTFLIRGFVWCVDHHLTIIPEATWLALIIVLAGAYIWNGGPS